MTFELSSLRSAVEFGFKGCEKGYNLQKVLNDFDELMKGYGFNSLSNEKTEEENGTTK